MELLNDYADRLKHLPFDLRAELVLADMLEDGVSLDALILNPVGSFNRATGRDISGTEWIESGRTTQRWLQINLNRSGLYDLVPEGVFHQPATSDTLSTKEDILREMALQRRREEAARQFFLPLEQEFLRQRVQTEQQARTFLLNPEPDDRLSQFWALPRFLTPVQTKRLLYLLPLMHRLAGDTAAMTACFEQLVDERVSLQLDSPGTTLIQTSTAPLGEWQLGDTSVFDGYLSDEEPRLRLTIYLDRSERVADYLPGATSRRLIEWLSGYLVPLDVSLHIDLDTSAIDDAFLLTDYGSDAQLSFTTYL